MTALDTDRADWLAWRRHGLGGSDIAAILGLSPWQSPWALWADKVGLTHGDNDTTEAMEFGRRVEPVLAPWFTDLTGLHVVGEQTWCTHPGQEWMRCTVDGFVADSPTSDVDAALGVVEFKATSAAAAEWETQIPVGYQCQATWNMLVTGVDRCWFGVLHLAFGRPQFRVYELALDVADADTVLAAARSFWFDHVAAGVPPATDGSTATRAALAAAWPDDNDQAVDVPGDIVHLLADLKAQAKDLGGRIVAVENELKAALGENAVGLVDGDKAVSWKTQTSDRLDTAALRKSWPDLAREFTRTTSSRVLRLHLKGD